MKKYLILASLMSLLITGCTSSNEDKVEDAANIMLSKAEGANTYAAAEALTLQDGEAYPLGEMEDILRSVRSCIKESNEEKIDALSKDYDVYIKEIGQEIKEARKNETITKAQKKFEKNIKNGMAFDIAFQQLKDDMDGEIGDNITFLLLFGNISSAKEIDRSIPLKMYYLRYLKFYNDNMPEESTLCNNGGLPQHTDITDINISKDGTSADFIIHYDETIRKGSAIKKDKQWYTNLTGFEPDTKYTCVMDGFTGTKIDMQTSKDLSSIVVNGQRLRYSKRYSSYRGGGGKVILYPYWMKLTTYTSNSEQTFTCQEAQ